MCHWKLLYLLFCESKSVSCSVMSNSLWPHGLGYSALEFSRQEHRAGGHSLLQGIIPTQGSDPGLLHCRHIAYQPSHQGSPIILYQLSIIIIMEHDKLSPNPTAQNHKYLYSQWIFGISDLDWAQLGNSGSGWAYLQVQCQLTVSWSHAGPWPQDSHPPAS